MIRGIHHVAVHVHDLDRMVRFYREAFGFEPIDPDGFAWEKTQMMDQILDLPGSAARGIMLMAHNCHLELFRFSAPQPAGKHPLAPSDKGYTHFCVDVTDIEAEYERLKGVGMTFGHPHPLDVGHVKTIYGRDPEGNIIEIQETTAICDFKLQGMQALA